MGFFIFEARRADIIVKNHKNRIIKTPKGWHYYLIYYILPTLIDIDHLYVDYQIFKSFFFISRYSN